MWNDFFKGIPWWAQASFVFIAIVLGVFGYDNLTQNISSNSDISGELTSEESLQKVQITVLDRQTQESIENVNLRFTINGPSVDKITDRKGYIELLMPPRDSVEVTFSHPDYGVSKEIINLQTDPETTRVIYLNSSTP
ncbi:hypothetical protein IQ260_11565 [Leptolyngbya cf. ectocarpi LEGE 11479]|uniref:Uncharacterized protein n=1 Tax=Leptolyngbya cf. ectocarpi LEGE 11479 TaxID=1828722 RepID=A0A928X2M0_LEPEC|nr:hypothetical protein [Leptolyngbya ectocarpi]MBE9067292.1 hypothetical protein [Leptolyngbya cf. ectocarpi LEGE 11479]